MVTDGKQDCPLSFYFFNARIILLEVVGVKHASHLPFNYRCDG